MAHKINGALNVVGQILNLKPEVLSADPTLQSLGNAPRLWVNGTDGILKFFNGTAIKALGENDGVTEAELTAALAPYAKTADVTSAISTAVAGLASEQDVADAVQNLVSQTAMTNAIENALAGLDFQSDVVGLESEFVDQAGRYIYVDGSKFATGVAAEAGDIVVVDAAGVIVSVAYDVSVAGAGALVWNTTAVAWLRWDGVTWAKFGGLSGVTAGNGISKNGDELTIKLDGATLTVGPNGLKVGDLSDTYATVESIAGFLTEADITPIANVVNALQLQIGSSFFVYDSGAESKTVHTIDHNMNYEFPVVTVYDRTTKQIITADTVEATSVNRVVVTLGEAAEVVVSVAGRFTAV